MNEDLKSLRAVIAGLKAQLQELSLAIWSHPETAWQEFFAAAEAKKYLEKQGFAVESGCFGVETAFKCEYGNGNSPCVAIAAEYDALPEIGHGCGHNLICVAGIAAFIALAEKLKNSNIPGKVILLGTPAEEGAGGKVRMLANGCLDGVDAAMMLHPNTVNATDSGSTANAGLEVVFHGRSAHAAASPEKGINALDAVNLLFAAVGAFRQQMPGCAMIHGIITNGGAAPNIIPDRAVCRFYLRTADENYAEELERRFRNMVKGAELMTDCTAEITPFRERYAARKPNAAMNEEYAANMEALGLEVRRPERQGKGSSDFGNFSQKVPGIHPYFALSEDVLPHPAHSVGFRDASATDYAFENAMNGAASMAQTLWKFITDEKFRAEVKKDFEK